MVRVRLLLFALYRDLAGTGEIRLELPAGATAAMLVDAVRGRGELWRLPDSPVVAINRCYASLESALSDGDEVALLPPVAGG
jgi:molybdopterin converting factor small subunit